jgi:hypothetical protein
MGGRTGGENVNAIPIKWLEQQVNSKDTKLAVAAWRVLEAWKQEKEAR